jgi:LysM repeat protein
MFNIYKKKSCFAKHSRAQAAMLLIASGCSLSALAAEPSLPFTVREGDKLINVARDYLIKPESWNEVAAFNQLKNPNSISLGQTLNIPLRLLKRVPMPGKVISVQGDVQVAGVAAQAGAALPEGAKLQTGANSSAIVELGDGSRVQLMPSSVADVLTQHGYAMRDASGSGSTTWFSGAMRLAQGVIETLASKTAKRATPLEVSTPTSMVGVRGTEFRVAYENPASGIARAEILEGQVRTENTTQKVAVDMPGGTGAAVDPKEREIKVVALLPPLRDDQIPGEVLRAYLAPRAANWGLGTLPGAASYRAQLASDAQFNKLQSDIKSATPGMDLSSLPNGKWYARVRGVDPLGIEGVNAVKLIEIKDAAPPKLVWPTIVTVGSLATYTPQGVLLKVNLSSADTPQELTLQIARDATFTQELRSVLVPANDASVLLDNLRAGERSFVRFSGTTPQGVPGTSSVFALDIPQDWGTSVLNVASALKQLP